MAFRKLTDFIQEDVIVALLRDKLWARTVARSVVDIRTQAQLGYGSSYKIPGVGTLTVTNYNGTALTNQEVSSTNAIITIDKYPVVPYYLEDSDVTESTALSIATTWAEEAANTIAQVIDKDVFAAIFADGTTSAILGITTTPIALTTGADVLAYIEDYATQLREANIETDTAIVLPSFAGIKLATELGVKVQNEVISGEGIGMGYVSTIFGYQVYTSNNLPTGTAGGLAAGEYAVVAGKRNCFHLIEGMSTVKSGDSETRMATWNHIGTTYGRGYSQELGWIVGVVKK